MLSPKASIEDEIAQLRDLDLKGVAGSVAERIWQARP
jgi:hypothetical protein